MNNLRVIENSMVPVYQTDKGESVVYGSELHNVLGVETPYRLWVSRRIDECDAVENEDYITEQICTVVGGTPRKEHIIKLDTAKEMAMLERNEKGKQVRRYFIEVEKKYKSGETAKSSLDQGFDSIERISQLIGADRNEKISMIENLLIKEGITTCFLPERYVSKGSNWDRNLATAAVLLKKNGLDIPHTKFTKILVEAGYLKEKAVPCLYNPKKTTKYKVLTLKGLHYGKNCKSANRNEYVTVPRYYDDTFLELYNSVMQ